jgi:excisionase family DNA binding protein
VSPIDRLLTMTQAAPMLGLSVRALRHRIRRGQIPAVPMGRRVMMRESDLQSFIASRPYLYGEESHTMTDNRRLGVADMLDRMRGDVIAKFDDALGAVEVLAQRLGAIKHTGLFHDELAAVKVIEYRLGTIKRTLLEDLRGAAQVLRDDGEPR